MHKLDKSWFDSYQIDDGFMQDIIDKVIKNKTYGTTATAAKPAPPKSPPKKLPFNLSKTFTNPSGNVHLIKPNVADIAAYLFSEYEYGKDWMENGDLLMVADKVLTDLQLRFA